MKTNLNFEVGDIIERNGVEYKIMGDDSKSDHHPAGHKKFDYILRRIDTNELVRKFKSEMEDYTLKSRLNTPTVHSLTD